MKSLEAAHPPPVKRERHALAYRDARSNAISRTLMASCSPESAFSVDDLQAPQEVAKTVLTPLEGVLLLPVITHSAHLFQRATTSIHSRKDENVSCCSLLYSRTHAIAIAPAPVPSVHVCAVLPF